MVSIALPSSEQSEREVHGHFTQRVIAQSRNSEQNISWVQRTGRGETQTRKSTMQIDSEGLSWVNTIEAQQLEQQHRVEKIARRVTNENHREMVGAEPSDPATPTLKPLFSSKPVKGKFSARLKEAAQPKSLVAALLN